MKKLLYIAICSLLLASCVTTQKAKSVLDSKPIEAAKYCAEKFPIKDSIVFRDSTHFDTIYSGSDPVFDTVTEVRQDTVYKTVVKTLPVKTITKTVVQTKEVYQENTAKTKFYELENERLRTALAKANDQIQAQQNQIKSLKHDRSKWRLYFFLLLTVTVAWKFRKGAIGLIQHWVT